MAAIFSALLLVGLFLSHAAAASAAPDIKLNGVDDLTTLTSGATLTATVQMDAGEQAGEDADWWIAAQTPMGWYYYAYPDGWVLGGDGMEDFAPAYQGALIHLKEPMEVLRISDLPVGDYVFYFGVDTTVNGVVDGSLSYDRIVLKVVEAVKPGSFPVVDTGQAACYDDLNSISCPVSGESFYGQDAQHSGKQPS